MRHLARLATLADQAMVSGGTFLTILLCARTLPADEMGKVGYLLTGYMATVILGMSVIYQVANANARRYQTDSAYRATVHLLHYLSATISTTVITLFFILAGDFINWQPSPLEALLLAGFLFLQQTTDLHRREHYTLNRPLVAAGSSILVYGSRILLLATLPLNSMIDVTYVLIGTAALTAFLSTSIFLLRLLSKLKHDVFNTLRWHLGQAKFLVATTPMAWMASYLPFFVLGNLQGLAAVGIMLAVRSLTNVFNLFLEILETRISANAGLLHNRSPERLRAYLNSLKVRGFILFSVIAGLLFVLREEVLMALYDPSYRHYGTLLGILLIGQLMTFLFRLSAVEMRTTQRHKAIFAGYSAEFIVVATTAYPLVSIWSMEGAATNFALGAMTNVFVQKISSKRHEH